MTAVASDAERVLAGLTPAQRLLAAHTALPAAVNAELVRLMRDNFLLDGPVTAESEAELARLLLSPLFSPVDDDLYEMQVAARAVLLTQLEQIDGGARLIEVAVLLERYVVERAHWPMELQWAQKISARVVADPADVRQFLDAGAAQGGGHGLDGRWYAAVRARVEQQQAASATLRREFEDSPTREGAALVELILRTNPGAGGLEGVLDGLLYVLGERGRLTQRGSLPQIVASVVADARAAGRLAEIVDWVWAETDDDGRVILSSIAMRLPRWTVAELDAGAGRVAAAFRVTSFGLWITPAHVLDQASSAWSIREFGRSAPQLVRQSWLDEDRDVAILLTEGAPRPALSFGLNPEPGDVVSIEAPPGVPAISTTVTRSTNRAYGVGIADKLAREGAGCPLTDSDGAAVGMVAAAGRVGSFGVSGSDIQLALAHLVHPSQLPTRWSQPADGRLYLQLAGCALAQDDIVRYEAFIGAAADIALHHDDRELLAEAVTERRRAETRLAETRQPVPPELLEFAARFEEISTINNRADRLSRRGNQLIRLRDAATRHRDDPEWSAAVPALLGADRAAEQLVGIVLLQVEPDPDPARLSELAAFVDPSVHPAHLGYEAIVALGSAAASRGSWSHVEELTAALDTVMGFLDGQESTDRARLLRQIRLQMEEHAQPREVHSDWKLWRDRSELRVRFLGGSQEQQAAVSALADEWTAGSGISFRFLPPDSAEHAEIRIAIAAAEASWSYLGTEALRVPAEQPTMSVDVVLPLTGRARGQVLMQLGHALGLVDEHQQPHAVLPWNRASVLRTYTAPPAGWTPEMVERNFLTRYEFPPPPDYRPFDPTSVMLHEFPPELFLDGSGTRANSDLSGSDRAFVARLYPPPDEVPADPSVLSPDQRDPAVRPLNGAQRKALMSALTAAYPTYDDLDFMLATETDRTLARYAGPGRMTIVVFNVVNSAEAEGWIDQLVTAASLGNPANPQLTELLASGFLDRTTAVRHALDNPRAAGVQALLPGAGILAGQLAQLDRIVKSSVGFRDVVTYANALLDQAARVCRVSVPTATGRSGGTGFLVGPDLVLTTYHLLQDVINGGASPSDVECVFDYRTTFLGTAGRRYTTAVDWLVAWSPLSNIYDQVDPVGLPGVDELDFALIRLAGEPGRTVDAGGRERGWLDLLAEPPPLTTGMPLLVLQHPQEGPMKLAVDTDGVVGVNANRTRVRYGATTLPGSSGSPCFTFDLKLVALHQSSQASRAAGEGVPIAAIAEHLRETGQAGAPGG